MHEELRSGLRTFDSMLVLKDSGYRFAAAIAVAVASVGHLVVSSAVAVAGAAVAVVAAADDSGIVDCIVTNPHRSLLCQPVG